MKYRIVRNGLGEYSVQRRTRFGIWKLVGYYSDWHGRFEYNRFASKEGAQVWIDAQWLNVKTKKVQNTWEVV